MHIPNSILDRDSLISILRDPLQLDWRAHGIGMLKTYLDPATRHWRLDLWHSVLVTPGISTMHTHPWPFTSFVMAGKLHNYRYARRLANVPDFRRAPAEMYHEGKIACGAHYRGLEGDSHPIVPLVPLPPEVYSTGNTYAMLPDEIHRTTFRDGTITVICRGAPETDGETASVFWPAGEPWGDATSEASDMTILRVTGAALNELELNG